MENKMYHTLLGDIRVIRIEKDMVEVVYKDKVSYMHTDFLKLLIVISERPKADNTIKFKEIRNNAKARKIFQDILESPTCLYTMEEVRDIAFAYAVFLHNEE